MAFFPQPKTPPTPEIKPKYILFKTDASGKAADLSAFEINARTGSVTVGKVHQEKGDDFGATFGFPGAKASKYWAEFKPPWSSDFAVIPWPSRIQMIENASTTVTQAYGGPVIERNVKGSGFNSGDWIISGQIAPLPFTVNQYLVLSDLTNYQQFANQLPIPFLILKQAIDLTNEVVQTPGAQLIMYSLQEGEYWYVEPVSRARFRAAPLRTGLTYEFAFKLLQKAEPPVINPVYRAAVTEDKSWFDKAIEAIQNVIKFAKAILAVLEYVKDRIGQFVNQIKALVEGIAQLFDDIMGFIESIVSAPEKLAQWGKNLAASVVASWNDMMFAVESMTDFFEGLGADDSADDDNEAISPSVTEKSGIPLSTINVLNENSANMLAAMDTTIIAMRMGLGDSISNKSARAILPGDTLEQIATEVYGGPQYAQAIAQWNNLKPPYITNTGIPGTIRPGQLLYLPKAGTAIEGTLATFEPMEYGEQFYGRGLKLVSHGDWKGDLQISGDGLGIDEVIGNDCVAQGLRVRMQTPFGEDRTFPLLGLPSAIGQITDDTNRLVFNIATAWQLRADNRVDKIDSLNISDNAEALKIDSSMTLKSTANQIQVAI
jgi:hypothetical protein